MSNIGFGIAEKNFQNLMRMLKDMLSSVINQIIHLQQNFGNNILSGTVGGYDGRGVFMVDHPTPEAVLIGTDGLTLRDLAEKSPDKSIIIEEYMT